MGARAIWKAELHLGDETVPVKLYSAVQDRNIHFKLLHEPDQVPLQQRRVNPLTDETVPYEATRRAYEAERDLFVVLDEDELASAEPPPSRAITVTRFVDPALINHQWYERPYYLGPDGHEDDYFALAAALAKQNKEGVARWTMRNKGYVGALRAEGPYLMLIALRSADEIIPAAELEPPSGRQLAKEELKHRPAAAGPPACLPRPWRRGTCRSPARRAAAHPWAAAGAGPSRRTLAPGRRATT